MFEDSTFESTGRIRTRSRGWMIAAFIFNGSILLALILIPLIYPEALPRQVIAFLMEVPPPPTTPEPPKPQPVHTSSFHPEMEAGRIFAPSVIPLHILQVGKPETLPNVDIAGWGSDAGGPGGPGQVFPGQTVLPVVRPEPKAPLRLPSTVVAALLLQKTIPVYPSIPKAAGIQGTVILAATISKAGTIENPRVVSGPAMLQQAALDAVKTWLYRPYLLNGQPVEVETTINVIFTLTR
ncbi:MAG: energy transducer TonB [Terracidiphilus sp.]|jgi:protein TonB